MTLPTFLAQPGLLHPLGPDGHRFRVSSPFGAPRSTGPHQGVDLACPVGTPVYGSGRVVRIDRVGDGDLEGNGNAVWLERDGVRFAFLHLDQVLVAVGDEPHGVIGLSGNTGASTGPHLHLGCWTQGETSADRRLLDPGVVYGEPTWSIR